MYYDHGVAKTLNPENNEVILFDFDVDLGFHIRIRIRTRLLGVDTPERGHEDFHTASNVLKGLLDNIKDEEGFIYIDTHKTGKYGRWLVDIACVNSTMANKWPYNP